MAGRSRTVACVVVLLAASATVSSACLPSPSNEFDDYVNKTVSYRASGVVDAGPIDSQAPTMPISGVYYAACLTQLSLNEVNRVLSFYTEATFTPDPSGSGGSLTMKFTPLKTGSTGFAPPNSVSLSETDATDGPITLMNAAVDAQGVFKNATTTPSQLSVPGDANPVSHRDIVISNVAIPGRFQPQQFCCQLSGQVTVPLTITLDPSMNTCLFFAVHDGDQAPPLTNDMFAAGCPLD